MFIATPASQTSKGNWKSTLLSGVAQLSAIFSFLAIQSLTVCLSVRLSVCLFAVCLSASLFANFYPRSKKLIMVYSFLLDLATVPLIQNWLAA